MTIFGDNRGGALLAVLRVSMSQQALETALGKLICDEAFRRKFYEDAEGAVRHCGLLLTPIELSSLRGIRLSNIEFLARHVDDRIRRAEEPQPRRQR